MIFQERYLIGVPQIDSQHRSLFSAIERVKNILTEDSYDRNRRVCVEAIKFFEDHALQHFADEEKYMRSIDFPLYEAHKAHHDDIRQNLEKLKADIVADDYAPESVKHFLGTMMAWLSYHTFEIDSLINKASAVNPDASNSAAAAMEKAVVKVAYDVFQARMTLTDSDYKGLPYGSKIFCLADCSHPDGRSFRVMGAISQQIVLQTINFLFSMKLEQVDELALSAVQELCAMLALHFIRNYQNGEFFHVDDTAMPDEDGFLARQPVQQPLCSLLFNAASGGLMLRVWDTKNISIE